MGNVCPVDVAGKIIENISTKTYDAFTPDIFVDKELDLEELGLFGKIIEIPGHTEGSLVVAIENMLFVGDIIRGSFNKPTKPAIHSFHCDLKKNKKNIQLLIESFNSSHWFTGHLGYLKKEDLLIFSKEI